MQSGPPRKRIRQVAGQSVLSFHRSDETEKRWKLFATSYVSFSSCYCALHFPIVPCHRGTTKKWGHSKNCAATIEMHPAPLGMERSAARGPWRWWAVRVCRSMVWPAVSTYSLVVRPTAVCVLVCVWSQPTVQTSAALHAVWPLASNVPCRLVVWHAVCRFVLVAWIVNQFRPVDAILSIGTWSYKCLRCPRHI